MIAEHNQELADTLNARTFALAQGVEGAELMMNICSTCQGAQSECQERLDGNSEYRDHINGVLSDEGLTYDKGISNKHFLWLMVEEIGLDTIASKVKRIYKHVHEKSRRYELNLYVVGKEEDDAPPEGVAVGREATPAHSSSAGHTPAERSPNR